MEQKYWYVKSSMNSKPDYKIFGNSLSESVLDNYKKIMLDLTSWLDPEHIYSMDLRWQSGILSNRGGAELTMVVVNNKNIIDLIAWIEVEKFNIPEIIEWKKVDGIMKLI